MERVRLLVLIGEGLEVYGGWFLVVLTYAPRFCVVKGGEKSGRVAEQKCTT